MNPVKYRTPTQQPATNYESSAISNLAAVIVFIQPAISLLLDLDGNELLTSLNPYCNTLHINLISTYQSNHHSSLDAYNEAHRVRFIIKQYDHH